MAASSGFAWCAKMMVVGFLPLVFFLTSLIGLAKGYEVIQSLDSSCIQALTCIAMDTQNSPLFLAGFNDQIAT